MGKTFKLGFAACLTAAFLFCGCEKNEDVLTPNYKYGKLLSKLCEYTEDGVLHQNKTEYKYDEKGIVTEKNETELIDGSLYYTGKTEYGFVYDEKGRCTERSQIFTQMGEVTYTQNYSIKYDEEGRIIFTEYKDERSNGITYSRIEKYKYNEFGDKIEYEIITDGSKITEKWEYKYNEQGKKTECEHTYEYIDSNENWIEKETFTFTDNTINIVGEDSFYGKIIGEKIYTEDGHLKSSKRTYTKEDGSIYSTETKYSYDNNGEETLFENYVNGKLTEKHITEGNIETRVTYMYSENGELEQTSSTKTVYSNSGRILTRETSENGHISKSEYTYDENGKETSIKGYYDGELNTENKDYVYDKNKITYTECWYSMNRTTYVTLIYAD
jgi:antitoxin component YwqK of YwqJK toxin-antitoxin module